MTVSISHERSSKHFRHTIFKNNKREMDQRKYERSTRVTPKGRPMEVVII